MSTPQQPLPPKKEVALALLERSSVHIHIDPRLADVVVPTWFKKQAQLVLQIGLNMPVPIPDLRLDDDGMSCTLSFNRAPFFCVVPWTSVFAMVGEDKRGMVWPDDVPPEIAGLAGTKAAEPARKESPKRIALAVAPAPSSKPGSEGAARPKRARKKPAAAPRTEAAASSGSASSNASTPTTRSTPRAVPSPAAAPSQPDVAPRVPAPRAPAAAGGSARKPKRELPPYLRVVK